MKGGFMRRLIKFISVLLSLSICLSLLAGCKSKDVVFPELSYPEETSIIESTTFENNDSVENSNVTELTVALPYSEYTIDLLFKLFYAKSEGLFPEDSTGSDISIEYLDSIDIPWVINSTLISSDGASASNAEIWNNYSSFPDLFLANDIDYFVNNNYVSPLNDYMSNSDLIDSNSINNVAISSVIKDGELYGVPHYYSVMLLVSNNDFIPSSGSLSFRPTLDEFSSYLDDVKSEFIDEENPVIPFSRAYELTPYLSSAFNNDVSAGYLEFTSDAPVDFVENVYDSQLSLIETDADPRFSRNAAMWIVSSSEVPYWADYYLNNLRYSLLPCSEVAEESNIYASMYPICISNSCVNKSLAADFASFISFDVDALELIWRLEPQSGYFPVINNNSVWSVVNSDYYFGTESIVVQQFSNNIIVCPSHGSDTYNSVNSYCANYFEEYLNSNSDSVDFDYMEAMNG